MCLMYKERTVHVPVRVHRVLEEAGDMGKGTARTITSHLPRASISGANST